ncbi:MAG: glycosyltransferase family 4 protein [Bacteroidia bacterium]|nr:glycosyltransferase family 4 protein [Bacteroidia bacterium]
MSLKILQVCSKAFWPPKDGGALAMLAMTKAYHKAGHQVTVLMMNTPKHYLTLRTMPEEVQEYANFYAVDVDTSVKIADMLANIIFSRDESYHVQRFTSRAFRAELERILQLNEYDVIQLESLFTTQYVDSIRAHSDALVVYRAHNVEHEIWERRAASEWNPIKKYLFDETAVRMKKYEGKTLASQPFDAIIPITGRDAGLIKKLGAQVPVQVSPFAVDLEDLDRSEIEMEYPSVFFIGSMDWIPNQEGVDWFIKEVWPMINKRYPEVSFYLAGRNMPNRYQSSEKLNIKVVGEVESAAAFIKSKAVMVAPLLSGSGMRVKIIDGMAYGKAIVATRISAEGIGAKNGEHLMIADEPEDFAERVGVLLEHRDIYNIMSRDAMNFVNSRFDSAKQIASLVDFYNGQRKKKKQKS